MKGKYAEEYWGAIHSTKISGHNFRDNLPANGSRLRTGLVPFPSRDNFRAHFQNGGCWEFVVCFGIAGGFRVHK